MLLTMVRVAKILDVSEQTVRLLERQGKLPGKESRVFDDSTIFATSTGERNAFVRKAFKAKRSYKRGVLMNTEFRYKGPRREVDFRYVGREWAFLVVVIVLAGAILGVILAKLLAVF